MKTYYITTSGKLQRKSNTLLLQTKFQRYYIPIETVESIFILSDVDINVDLLEFLAKNHIPVHFFGFYGNYIGSFWPRTVNISGNIVVRQVSAYLNSKERFQIAKEFALASIENLWINVKPINVPIGNAQTISDLMVIEARARKSYFHELSRKVKKYSSGGRTRRPPKDPFNALLSFGYSLLYATVVTEIFKTALDPRISYLHEPFQSRFSLSLDVADIFKSLIVDRLVVRLLNNKVLKKSSFEFGEGIYLKEDAKRKFLHEYNLILNSTIRHKKLRRFVSYKYLIRLDLYKLIHYLIEGEELSFFRYSRRW